MLFNEKAKKGTTTVAYGCVATCLPYKPEETVLYKELLHMFHADYTYVEVVSPSYKKRPGLDTIINELKSGDRIYVSCIMDLLGFKNNAKVYYEKAVTKGIELVITDFNHKLLHIHPLSFCPTITGKNNAKDLLKNFDKYKDLYFVEETGGRKRHHDFSLEWKRIYFDYESYQINRPTLYNRMKEAGYGNRTTQRRQIAEYERSIEYQNDVLEYAKINPYFVKMPKRIIAETGGTYKFPEEYLCIKKSMRDDLANGSIKFSDFKKQNYIAKCGLENNFFINDVIFERYHLLETTKIPRKTRNDINIHFGDKKENLQTDGGKL